MVNEVFPIPEKSAEEPGTWALTIDICELYHPRCPAAIRSFKINTVIGFVSLYTAIATADDTVKKNRNGDIHDV